MFIKLISAYEKEKLRVLILIFPAVVQIKNNPSRCNVVVPAISG